MYRPLGEAESSVLIIPPYMCNEFNSYIKSRKIAEPFICNSQVVKKIKKCFEDIKASGDNKIKQQGYVYVILGILLESASFDLTDDKFEPGLSLRLVFYIHENYKEKISLDSLSACFGYTQSYISRCFACDFNMGINEYLSTIRLKNAVMLMSEKKHSITYCALESGFSSLRSFYRIFSKKYNCSPKEYIKDFID